MLTRTSLSSRCRSSPPAPPPGAFFLLLLDSRLPPRTLQYLYCLLVDLFWVFLFTPADASRSISLSLSLSGFCPAESRRSTSRRPARCTPTSSRPTLGRAGGTTPCGSWRPWRTRGQVTRARGRCVFRCPPPVPFPLAGPRPARLNSWRGPD